MCMYACIPMRKISKLFHTHTYAYAYMYTQPTTKQSQQQESPRERGRRHFSPKKRGSVPFGLSESPTEEGEDAEKDLPAYLSADKTGRGAPLLRKRRLRLDKSKVDLCVCVCIWICVYV